MTSKNKKTKAARLIEQEQAASRLMLEIREEVMKRGLVPLGEGALADTFVPKETAVELREKYKIKAPKLEKRVLHVITMKVYVAADKKAKNDAMETLANYMRDWIPDEAPDDPIHIFDYVVTNDHCIDAGSPRYLEFVRTMEGRN